MRTVQKGEVPQVLADNQERWLADYQADPANPTRKYRYRDRSIKNALVAETSSKCVYCESKIGHNTPGDVEHKTPSSVAPERHFDWTNLTIACTECNRRKNDYFDAIKPFLDPYEEATEARVIHYGPVVGWAPGDQEAEISVRILGLSTQERLPLVLRKIEKLEELNVLRGRIASEANETLRSLLEARLEQLMTASAEYSAMVCAVCAVRAD